MCLRGAEAARINNPWNIRGGKEHVRLEVRRVAGAMHGQTVRDLSAMRNTSGLKRGGQHGRTGPNKATVEVENFATTDWQLRHPVGGAPRTASKARVARTAVYTVLLSPSSGRS